MNPTTNNPVTKPQPNLPKKGGVSYNMTEFKEEEGGDGHGKKSQENESAEKQKAQVAGGATQLAGSPTQPEGLDKTANLPMPQAPKSLAVPSVKSNALQGDIIIPRILLMQDISKLVKSRKAFAGQIVRSTTGEVLGGISELGKPAKTIDIIPLSMSTGWTVRTAEGFEWVRSEPRTPANDHLPWEFEEDGRELKRLKTIDLVCLISKDVAAQLSGTATDEDGVIADLDSAVLLPSVVSFLSTGFKAGKNVSTFFAKVEQASRMNSSVRPYHYTLPLGCIEETGKNDTSWFAFEVGKSSVTPKKYREVAENWYSQVQTSHLRVQDEGEAENAMSQRIGSQAVV